MRGSQLRRRLLAVALLAHFSVLVLAALPASRFVEALYPLYGWYIRVSGQGQNWAMYQYPARDDSDFELIARFPDGHEERPWGLAPDMRSRELYFLEALFVQGDERLGNRFLEVLRQRWDGPVRPSSLVVRRTLTGISDFRKVPEVGTRSGSRSVREIERRW
ncbi:MAG TPA: hypothetical protein VER33_28555 [Polyangiaceae bacterium]|nr:hypothetical protein [Polyangiaceae bacterium]